MSEANKAIIQQIAYAGNIFNKPKYFNFSLLTTMSAYCCG
jgi:hypothetical protein